MAPMWTNKLPQVGLLLSGAFIDYRWVTFFFVWGREWGRGVWGNYGMCPVEAIVCPHKVNLG